jgi:hypothetical protein
MMRGTFANIRIRNEMVPGVEGGMTRHLPDSQPIAIYDAAMLYKAEGIPLAVIAGKEYGPAPVATGRRKDRVCSASGWLSPNPSNVSTVPT